MEKRIVYTGHAWKKKEKRKVPDIWVEETIKWPDVIKREGKKYLVIKKVNGKTLKVVYEKENDIKVITVYYLQ